MLTGRAEATIDDKGRMSVPVKFRDYTGSSFIMLPGFDRQIIIYSMDDWKVFAEKIARAPEERMKKLRRFVSAYAEEVSMDKAGRILISASLRKSADIIKDVMVTAAFNKIEIWDREKWHNMMDGITLKSIADELRELDDMGMF